MHDWTERGLRGCRGALREDIPLIFIKYYYLITIIHFSFSLYCQENKISFIPESDSQQKRPLGFLNERIQII